MEGVGGPAEFVEVGAGEAVVVGELDARGVCGAVGVVLQDIAHWVQAPVGYLYFCAY